MSKRIPKAFRLERSHLTPIPEYGSQKRLFDILLTTVALPFALPVLALCAIAVRLSSPGPILFKQSRTGKDGKKFNMLKFRSMVVDAPELKQVLAQENKLTDGPDFKMVNDPRVTKIGAILRKSSLDELPQLWNVISGEMSLVGPRPTSFDSSTYTLWHTERLEASPGLTGLWQVEKRGDLDFDERVRLDIAYIRNRSLRLDLLILLRTIPAVIQNRGAY